MRPIWKGSISFGLVNIPVKLYAATEDKRIHFRQLHARCQTPIKYKKWCPYCQSNVEGGEIVRGFEVERDRFVILADDEIELLTIKSSRTVDIIDFIDLGQVDPVYYNRSYYLGPAAGGEKAYYLLEQTMVGKERAALGKVVLRAKENLVLLRPYEGAIIMETLYYPDEIRGVEQIGLSTSQSSIENRELVLASQLVEALTVTFQPDNYKDRYREELLELINRKAAGEELTRPAQKEDHAIADLMESLQASLKALEKESHVAGPS